MAWRAATLLAIAIGAGCYSPTIYEGQFTCMRGPCPTGFECVCGSCVAAGGPKVTCDMATTPGNDMGSDLVMTSIDNGLPPDFSVVPDLTPTTNLPCSNGGVRSPNDPGQPNFAFCPAAWLVPGIMSAATPCNRTPGPSGMSGPTSCAAEDNCSPGWHVCLSESDMMNKGMNKSHCQIFDAEQSFWATRQAAAPMMMAPPQCNATPTRVVMGCGGLGIGAASDCTIVATAMVDTPTMGDDCDSKSGGVWRCPNVDQTHPEKAIIIKTSTQRGGVICCRD